MNQIELTVLMPCLNEAETLEICIRKAQRSMADLGIRGEVLIADNGSTDGSQAIANGLGARVVDVPARGYGAALQSGIANAAGEFVIMADADDSYALDDLKPFVESLRGGADLVMGNRFRGGIAPGAMPPLHRYLGNPVLSFLGRLFFKVPIGDFHCGMRGFRKDRMLGLRLRTTGMEFASEMVARSALARLRIVEVPTTLRPDGRSRGAHLRTWPDGWRHLKFLLALSPRWVFLYPAVLLLVLGLVATVALAFSPIRLGGLAFDVQTMVAAATCLIAGTQMSALALVARAYAAKIDLLPPSHRLERLVDRIAMERGLVLGLVLVLFGLGAWFVALVRWAEADYGALTTGDMRVPILGMVTIVAGLQTALVSFTLSLTRIGEP